MAPTGEIASGCCRVFGKLSLKSAPVVHLILNASSVSLLKLFFQVKLHLLQRDRAPAYQDSLGVDQPRMLLEDGLNQRTTLELGWLLELDRLFLSFTYYYSAILQPLFLCRSKSCGTASVFIRGIMGGLACLGTSSPIYAEAYGFCVIFVSRPRSLWNSRFSPHCFLRFLSRALFS